MEMMDKHVKLERDKVNDYRQTVNAILGFAALVVHDRKANRPNSCFGFGRRMTTSPHNPSPSSEIAPDLVVQKSNKYGIVAEAKKSLNQNQADWIDHIEQLRKYDDDIDGWWTTDEKISQSDAIMLIHHSRSRAFVGFMESRKNKIPDSVGPNTSVVEFSESPEGEVYYFYRLEYGNLNDTELNKALYNGVPVPLERVKKSFSNIQYYDSPPPLPLLLMRLWTDYFPSKLDEGEYDEKTKSTKIKIAVSDATDELQKAFGSQALHKDKRSSEFPAQKWIREAFDKLAEYKLAVRGSSNGEYITHFKWFRGDVLERFVKLEFTKVNKEGAKSGPKQMNLF
jgi:hypothetical protein